MKNASDIAVKILAIALLIAATLKGWQLLTEPAASRTPGLLAETKEWFVTTPAVALLTDGKVISAWEEKAPDFETILQDLAKIQKNTGKFAIFINKPFTTFAIDGRR
ncbi:MAG: hypothetical protein KAV87_56225 [Desulfobacteraceae bacterium]|nr:hypothetical protein [Desulfobacteraceae bacterium]